MRIAPALLSTAALAASASAQVSPLPLNLSTAGNNVVLINEIRIDQPGADNDEYVELIGIAGDQLNGLSYIVIGDGSGGSGVIEEVISLETAVIPADGTLLIAESSMTIGVPDLETSVNFENSDNVTHLIALGFTGAEGDDLDTDDDGTLDVLPWIVILDAISLVETPGSGEQYYASTLFTPFDSAVDIGPNGNFVPAHVYRCTAGGTFQDVRIGEFDFTTFNLDTPGTLNGSCLYAASAFCDPGLANSASATGGRMGLEGSPFLTSNDAILVAEDIPDFFGVFVQATGAGSASSSPIGGNFCINAGIERLAVVAAAGNRAEYAFDFTDSNNPEFAAMAGSTLYYQFFHRDTPASAPQGGNWTNGIAITWAP